MIDCPYSLPKGNRDMSEIERVSDSYWNRETAQSLSKNLRAVQNTIIPRFTSFCENSAWTFLGYDSFEEWCEKEELSELKLSLETKAVIVQTLREEKPELTTREVEKITGISKSSVSRLSQNEPVPSGTTPKLASDDNPVPSGTTPKLASDDKKPAELAKKQEAETAPVKTEPKPLSIGELNRKLKRLEERRNAINAEIESVLNQREQRLNPERDRLSS